jgi:hypothetical protein
MKKVFLGLVAAFIICGFMGCGQLFGDTTEVTTNTIPIIWKGSLATAPSNPSVGWAYYNITQKTAFIWDGDSWEILAQDGVSIIWKGELPAAPSSPQTNWAYYNIIDGNSYIWNGYEWDLLAKTGRDGASGILLWLGTLAQAPANPSAGYAYYNSTQGTSYIWDGDSWEILARDGTGGQNGIDGIDGIDGTNGIGIIWKGALSSSPISPQINWAYYDTNNNTSYIWDGDSWEILAESGNSTIIVPISWQGSLTAAPINPQIGWMYYNSILGKSYIWDGSSWNIVAQDGTDGQNGQDGTGATGFLITWKGGLPTAPSNPQQGWAYYNTDQKKSYIWDGSSWQILTQDGSDGQNGTNGTNGAGIVWKGEFASAPQNPELNWAYYNTSDKKAYIWDGSSWQILAQDGTDGQNGTNGTDGTGIVWKGEFANAPQNPELNWAYYNTSDKKAYIWNGSSWQILAQDGADGQNGTNGIDGTGIVWKGEFTSAPQNPALNWAYYNTSDKKAYIWNGGSWQILAQDGADGQNGTNGTDGAGIVWKGEFANAPQNPEVNWAYYNTSDKKAYIWNGSRWQILAQDGADGQNGKNCIDGTGIVWKGEFTSAPQNPALNWAYYNTSQKKAYIWDGSSWQILAQDGADGTGGTGVVPSTYLYVIVYTSTGNYFESASQSIGTVDFGQVGIGSSMRTTLFYITLQGGGSTLNLTGNPAIQISGTNADCFSVTQPSTTSTTTGTYIMDASIAFTPNSLGVKIATITILNNSPDKPDFSFMISGEGSLWPKTYDSGEGDGDDRITCSVIDSIDSQENVYFIGYGFELINNHSGNDWWIKKFNSAGNEVTTGWNKKIDLNGSASTTYDVPTNAIIDSFDNLIVSDGYNTIKFASDGTETWRKNVGGTLYVDSQNYVFVATGTSITKYNAAGAAQWTKAYTGKLAFDSSDNVAVYSADVVRHVSSGGTENWGQVVGDLDTSITAINGWYNSSIEIDETEYWRVPVVNGKTYGITWNDRNGDGTKAAYLSVSTNWEDDNSSIFTQSTNGWSTPKTFTATKTGTVIIKVSPLSNSSSYTGTYAIAVTDWYTNGTSITDGWYNSSLATDGSETRVISVTAGKRYFVAWNEKGSNGDGTKTADVKVSAYWQDDSISIFSATDSGWSSPKNFLATKTGNVVVKIETYSSSASYAGTYGVVVKEAATLSCDKIIAQTISSAVFDSSGNIYTAGYGTNWIDAYSKKDAWIKKFNASGTEITSGWNKKYDWEHSDDEYASQVFFRDGNIIVIGQGNDLVNGSSKDDTWVKKFTPDGTELTSFVIPDNSAVLVKIDDDGNYYFSSGSTSSSLFRKYTASGSLLNSYSWNSKSPYVYPPLYIMDNSNNVYMYGYASNLVSSVSGYDWIIKKFNSAGVEQ